eukprot:TRINITY_DN6020_c0_g1_i1.p1 TRINITY_DN6020_c0_g1~~TRINITY_DN6020_c0_g1_i1.p1  ORF type:complete len:1338 (-),score=151.28 TRINITY_DN6020_c0_g1_i1:155-4168(-)
MFLQGSSENSSLPFDGQLEDEDLFGQGDFLSESEAKEETCEQSLFSSEDEDSESLFCDEENEEVFLQEPEVEAAFLDEEESDNVVAHLPSDSPSSQARIATPANNFWNPGANCGRWFSRWQDLSQQSQVLLCNVYLNCQRLCSRRSDAARSAYQTLSGSRGAAGTNLSRKLASLLLNIGESKVRDVVARMGSCWIPVAPRVSAAEPANSPGSTETSLSVENDRNADIMKIYLREIVHCAYYGLPDATFTRALCRHKLAGTQIGEKYHNRKFVRVTERFVASAVQISRAEDLHRTLPGLRIQSDIVVVFDGVSIGATQFSSQETLLLVGALHTYPANSEQVAALIGAPSMGLTHKGDAQCELVLQCLSAPPWDLDVHALRRRLSLVGGDGAVAKGGPEAKRNSTGAANLVWQRVHPGSSFDGSEWDLFHREVIAGKRAAEQSPAAAEIHEVSKLLVSLFGIGAGRVLLRGVADLVGTKDRRVAGTSGTRSSVYNARLAANMIDNFASYHSGIRARMVMVQEGSSSQTLSKLVGFGRRLCVLDFVSFLLLFRDAQEGFMKPFVLSSEKMALEPVEVQQYLSASLERFGCALGIPPSSGQNHGEASSDRERVAVVFDTTRSSKPLLAARWCKLGGVFQLAPSRLSQQHSQEIKDSWRKKGALVNLRFWLFVSTLLRGALSLQSFKILWGALRVSNHGRMFPTWVNNFVDLFIHRRFHDCELSVESDLAAIDSSKDVLLSPLCQCATMRTRPGKPRRTQLLLRQRRIHVPEWVAHSQYEKACLSSRHLCPERNGQAASECAAALSPDSFCVSCSVPKIRFQREVSNRTRSPQLQGVSLIHRGWCKLPLGTKAIYDALDKSLCAAASYMYSLRSEMEEYCKGDVGTNASMKRVLLAVRCALDWSHLLFSPPELRHVKSFIDLTRELAPTLRQTQWPPREEFPHIQHSWPQARELAEQYRLLCFRLRKMVQEEDPLARDWYVTQSFEVETVSHEAIRFLTLRALRIDCIARRGRKSSSAHTLPEIAVLIILEFVGRPPGRRTTFQSKPADLCRVGFGRLFRKARGNNRKAMVLQGRCGEYASVCGTALSGKWVLIIACNRIVNSSKVAASIELLPGLATDLDNNSRSHPWHAARVLSRARHLRAVETVNEKWGSSLHSLYDDVAGHSPARLVSRLVIREAGLAGAGGKTEEMFLRELAFILVHVQNIRPLHSRKRRRDGNTSFAVEAEAGAHDLRGFSLLLADAPGLRLQPAQSFREDPQALLHAPRKLPFSLSEAIRKNFHTHLDGRSVQSALPLFAGDKKAPNSTTCERLQKFLHSDEGLKWRRERAALWGGQESDSDNDL